MLPVGDRHIEDGERALPTQPEDVVADQFERPRMDIDDRPLEESGQWIAD